MFQAARAGAGAGTSLVIGLTVILLAGLRAAGWAWGRVNWQLGMQPPATPVKEAIHALHNELLVIIFAVTVFVLALLLYVIVRFRASRTRCRAAPRTIR